MKNILIIAVLVCNAIISTAQESAYHCYPTNWWAGMKWNKVQVMIHGKDVGNKNIEANDTFDLSCSWRAGADFLLPV